MKKMLIRIIAGIALFVILIGAGGVFFANKYVDAILMDIANDLTEEEIMAELAKGKPVQSADPVNGDDTNNNGAQGTEGSGSQGTEGNSSAKDEQKAQPTNKKIENPKVVYGVKIDTEDKARAVQIVTSKVPKASINELLALAKGGATPENKRKAKEILKRHLSAQDIKELKAIAARYAEGG